MSISWGNIMCIDSFVGIRNVDGTVSYIQGRFETNNLGMWLQCNMFNMTNIRKLMHEYYTNEKQHHDSINSLEEGLKKVDVIYLWDFKYKHWLEKTKETDWHKIGAN